MSYSEFIKELKLEDCVIASTRVDSADYKCDDLFGCVYKVFPQVLRGRTVVLKKGSCSCGGFNNNSGLVDDRPSIPGGFGVFLSHGSDLKEKNSSAVLKLQRQCLIACQRT